MSEPCTTIVVSQSDEIGTLFWLFFKNNFGKAPFFAAKNGISVANNVQLK
jgi:hypothetical protein